MENKDKELKTIKEVKKAYNESCKNGKELKPKAYIQVIHGAENKVMIACGGSVGDQILLICELIEHMEEKYGLIIRLMIDKIMMKKIGERL